MKKMFLFVFSFVFRPAYATETPLGNFVGFGPLGNFTLSDKPNIAIGLINKGLSILVGLLTAGAFFYFILNFFLGGLSWITAAGDQKKIESAQKQITMSVVGLVIVISAIFIIQLIGKVLGIKDILNPLNFLIDIWK